MIDWIAFLLAVATLALCLFLVWRFVGRKARSRFVFAARLLLCLVLAVPIVGLGAWRFCNSRSMQVVGQIVNRVETTEPVVALTFDDGPAPTATLQILRDLAVENVRATFFLIGSQVAAHPDSARALVAAGHEIGNHTNSHPRMLGLSQAHIADELESTDQLIRQAGYDGAVHFRSPFAKKFVALPLYLWRTNRINVLWDVEPESDSDVNGDPARIVRHVIENVRPGSIVLLHVMPPSRKASLAAVPQIVSQLRARGFRFVTVSELLKLRT